MWHRPPWRRQAPSCWPGTHRQHIFVEAASFARAPRVVTRMGTWIQLLGLLSLVDGAPQASLTGTVRDRETGSPVPGAVISLPHQQQRTLTDSLGRYRLPGIAAGPREISAHRIGYGSWTVSVLVPDSGTVTVEVVITPESYARGIIMRGANAVWIIIIT